MRLHGLPVAPLVLAGCTGGAHATPGPCGVYRATVRCAGHHAASARAAFAGYDCTHAGHGPGVRRERPHGVAEHGRARWFAVAIALVIVVWSHGWPELGAAPAPPIARPSLTGVVGVEGGPTSSKHPGFHPLARVPIRIAGTTAGGEHRTRQLTADHNGRFRLNLPPGRYHLTAIFPGWRGHAQVTVKPGHPVQIRLTEWVL
jgi:hypothetical protein